MYITKPKLFFKRKPNDIHTSVVNVHAKPLWEAKTNAKFILYPYVLASCNTFYLTKIDKSMTQEINMC
jgi:hypothetical protein